MPHMNGIDVSFHFLYGSLICYKRPQSVRPKYTKLLEHSFIKKSAEENVDVAGFVTSVLDRMQGNEPRPTESLLEKMEITEKNGS